MRYEKNFDHLPFYFIFIKIYLCEIVSHQSRMSSVVVEDKVYIVVGGKIVEKGTGILGMPYIMILTPGEPGIVYMGLLPTGESTLSTGDKIVALLEKIEPGENRIGVIVCMAKVENSN